MTAAASRDEINLVQEPHSDSQDKEKLLLFFITGNPGLIEYYQTFLTLCYDTLRKNLPNISIQIYGTSLRGFEIHEPKQNGHNGPFNLEQQIQHIEQSLDRLSQQQQQQSSNTKTRVILAGHSVGSYILLEVLRRRKARLNAGDNDAQIKVIGGLCLFPTVTHIAKSPSGQRFSLFSALPHFALLAGLFVRALLSWTPAAALQRLVGAVTGMPPGAAATTTAFLQTAGGVRQALFLARDEMASITEDRWDDEMWGVAGGDGGGAREMTKLFFLFGTEDHWVADETRDQLIAARADFAAAAVGGGGGGGANTAVEDGGKPVMEIDQTGIPHGFCIKHNDAVAKKVVGYVERIVHANW